MFTPDTPDEDEVAGESLGRSVSDPLTGDLSASYPFRLLPDEAVLGVFPLARAQRPLGRLVSYLFVTDSRLVYSAEARSVSSSSIHSREFHIHKIEGIEVGRHIGYDALGLVALIGSGLNFLILLILGLVSAGAATSSASSYGYDPFGALAGVTSLFVPIGIASLIIGLVVALVLRRPTTHIRILGPDKSHPIAGEADLPALLVLLLLFIVFGLFIGIAILGWVVIRELGVFRAQDAQRFAPPENVDRVAFELGTLILDVQSRGKLAGQG
ncbi:hypothetical protein [Microbacterium sp.]|uniref:hypothetical protein n=1 Tax=Microbacterium sp. TaxID=51671 RepID=UPI0039E3438B